MPPPWDHDLAVACASACFVSYWFGETIADPSLTPAMLPKGSLPENLPHACLQSCSDMISLANCYLASLSHPLTFLECWNHKNPAEVTVLLCKDKADTVYVAFAGTHDVATFEEDVDIDLVPFSQTAKAGHGFLRAADAALAYLQKVEHVTKAKRVVWTGHSLGAAVAVLVALRLGTPRHELYTFGSPRPGDAALSECNTSFGWEGNARFYLKQDPIPALPPMERGYADLAFGVELPSEQLDWWQWEHALELYLHALLFLVH